MAKIISNTIQLHVARKDESSVRYEFLALKRSDSDELYPSLWQCITGTSDSGEKAAETALRELEEETSIARNQIEKFWTIPFVGSFFDPYRDAVNMVPAFGVLVRGDAEVRISPEHSQFEWLSDSEIMELLPFPSHKAGHEIFVRYILERDSSLGFEYRLPFEEYT